MSEEVQNVDGVFGIAILTAVLFCISDVDTVINTKFSYPFIETLLQATNSVPEAAIMMAVIIVMDLGLCMASMAASSRMLWAFARDRRIPGWRTISKVSHYRCPLKQSTAHKRAG